jgi:hypothetical protein
MGVESIQPPTLLQAGYVRSGLAYMSRADPTMLWNKWGSLCTVVSATATNSAYHQRWSYARRRTHHGPGLEGCPFDIWKEIGASNQHAGYARPTAKYRQDKSVYGCELLHIRQDRSDR